MYMCWKNVRSDYTEDPPSHFCETNVGEKKINCTGPYDSGIICKVMILYKVAGEEV